MVVYDKKRIILGINNTPSIWHNIYNVIIAIEKHLIRMNGCIINSVGEENHYHYFI